MYGYGEWSEVRQFTTGEKPSIVTVSSFNDLGPHGDNTCVDITSSTTIRATSDNKDISAWDIDSPLSINGPTGVKAGTAVVFWDPIGFWNPLEYWVTYSGSISVSTVDYFDAGTNNYSFKTKQDPRVNATIYPPFVSVKKQADGTYYISGTGGAVSYGCMKATTASITSNISSSTVNISSEENGFYFNLGALASGTVITGTVTLYYPCHGKSSSPASFSYTVP